MAGVLDKLNEARYFLGKMDEEVHGDDFMPNFTAFLSAYRSVTLRIERAVPDDVVRGWYHGELRQRGFPYKCGKKWHGSDPILKLLKQLRDTDVHERPVILRSQINIAVQGDGIGMTDSVSWRLIGTDGSTVQASTMEPLATPEVPSPQMQVQRRWFFNDLPNEGVNAACWYALDQLDSLVQACQRQGIH